MVNSLILLMNIALNKILTVEEYFFYKEFMKEFSNMYMGNEHSIFTNTGVHSYKNFTQKKIKNIKYAGMYWDVPFGKIKPNLELLFKCIIDRYPITPIDLTSMDKLKILFIYDCCVLPMDNDIKYNFLSNLPACLEVLIFKPTYEQGLDYNFFSQMKNLPTNLKYLIFSLPKQMKNYTLEDLKKIPLPYGCTLYYSATLFQSINENLIKLK